MGLKYGWVLVFVTVFCLSAFSAGTHIRKMWLADEASGETAQIGVIDSDFNVAGTNALVTASVIMGRSSDGVFKPIKLDRSTRSIQTIDYEHHEIHSGSHFFVCGFETEANGGTIRFALGNTNTTKEIHMSFIISGTQQTEVLIYEDSYTTGGASSTPYNNNRNSSKVSTAISATTGTASPDQLLESDHVTPSPPPSHV